MTSTDFGRGPRPLAPAPRDGGVAFVTGAGGFIGGHVAAAFAAAGWRVGRFGHRHGAADSPPSDRGATGFFAGPISRLMLARAAGEVGRPAVIVHAAGGSSVAASVADPATDFDRTVGSLREVLDFMRCEGRGAKLIFLSSAAVYGSDHSAALREDWPANPISPYGLHKAIAEDLIRGWAKLWQLDACIVRLFSVYGPENRKQLLWDLATRLCAGPDSLDLSGTGAEERDFLHVDDAVRLVGMLAETPPSLAPLVVNGGSGEATTVRAVAEGLCATLASRATISFNGAVRPGDPQTLVADPELARGLGFSPVVLFAEGLAHFAGWARSTTRAAPSTHRAAHGMQHGRDIVG